MQRFSLLGLLSYGALCPQGAQPLQGQSSLVDSATVVSVRSISLSDTVFTDLEPLIEKIGSARIVVLGEATHSEGSTSLAKVRMVRFLHERMGFDVLAWEAGLLDAWRLNAALRGEEPIGQAATHLMRGGWDESIYSRPVFEYARASWSTDRPLLMAGFDGGRPPRGAAHLIATLDELFARLPMLRPAADDLAAVEKLAQRAYSYLGRSGPTITPAERKVAREAIGRVLAPLEEPTPELRARLGIQELLVLRLALRSALVDDSLRQVIVTRGPNSMLNYNRLRDSVMAVRLGSVADSLYPGRKIIVWAATAHLIRNSATITSLQSDAQYGAYRLAGDYLGPRYGSELYTIGFVAHGGEYGDLFAPGDDRGASRTGTLDAVHPESFEAAAHGLGLPYLFVDLRGLPAGHPMRRPFISHALGYIPNRANWRQVLDAFFFIDRAEPENHHPR
jgi:erythromycin esterase